MNNFNFDKKTGEEAVLDLRMDKLSALANYLHAQDSRTQLKESLKCLQEGVDYLRMIIKYQAFDLEATRRENEELKAMLSQEEQEPPQEF